MKIIKVEPMVSIGKVGFGSDRATVRKTFGSKYSEIKKSLFSNNTMDVYTDFHVFYSDNNCFEAIEIFGKVKVVVNGVVVFPSTVSEMKKIFPELVNTGEGLVDKTNSMGITVSNDNNEDVDSILFGERGYFE